MGNSSPSVSFDLKLSMKNRTRLIGEVWRRFQVLQKFCDLFARTRPQSSSLRHDVIVIVILPEVFAFCI
jgi:hypothetical protein